MKSRTILEVAAIAATIVIVATNCSDSAKPGSSGRVSSDTPISIEPGVCVGKVRPGMTVDEVIAELGKPDSQTGGGLEYLRHGFAVSPGRDGTVRAVLCGDSSGINGPLVKAFTGRTKEGIGMGSSRVQVVSVYGEPPEKEKTLAGREVVKCGSLGLTFSLENDKTHHIIVDFRKIK